MAPIPAIPKSLSLAHPPELIASLPEIMQASLGVVCQVYTLESGWQLSHATCALLVKASLSADHLQPLCSKMHDSAFASFQAGPSWTCTWLPRFANLCLDGHVVQIQSEGLCGPYTQQSAIHTASSYIPGTL